MKVVTYKAPAKVILSGEHAVVHGKPALITAIDKYLTFSVFPSPKKIKDKNILTIEQIVKKYLQQQRQKIIDRNYTCQIISDIPLGRGLGSSAAFSVAAAAAFLDFYTGKSYLLEEINDLAYQMERQFHANPSGADNSTVCFGGLIYYRKEFEFLKSISRLKFFLPEKIITSLYLVDTGKPVETTAEMVQRVKKDELLFYNFEKTVKTMVRAINDHDLLSFQQTIRENESLLEKIGVVSLQTKKHIQALSGFSAAKVTGAGGKKSGSGFILVSTMSFKKLEDYCQNNHLPIIKLTPVVSGVIKV